MTQFLLTASFFLAMSVLTFAASNTLPTGDMSPANGVVLSAQN